MEQPTTTHRAVPGARWTKVVATLGPASSTPEVVAAMVAAGMDVARLNFSHLGDDPEELRELVRTVHAAGERAGRPVAVLADLAGPELRLGGLDGPVELAEGDALELYELGEGPRDGGAAASVPVDSLASKVRVGERVLLADGMVEAVVDHLGESSVHCEVVGAGELRPNKKVHFPDGEAVGPALTDRDRAMLAVAIDAGVDVVAISFVTGPQDVEAVRALVGDRALVVAKIERAQAVRDCAAILAVADGIMVARGDLGVELAPEVLPGVQKELVRMALEQGRIAMVATEMLESMVHASRPTRAEVSDVANAALDGAGAVMLSAETAVGVNPVAAVAAMDRILSEVESHDLYGVHLDRSRRAHPAAMRDDSWAGPLSEAATTMVQLVGAEVVVVVTETGRTARLVAASRPGCPIVAVCHDPAVARRLALWWGVVPTVLERYSTGTPMRRAAVRKAAALLGCERGVAVLLSGAPNVAGGADTLRVVEISKILALPAPGA